MRNILKTSSLFIVLSIAFFSCKNEGNIKMGVIMPLTGVASEPGRNAVNGIELAISIYNDTAKYKIDLIVEDSKSSPRDGVSALNKVISSENAKIVIGDIMSSVFLACAPIAEKNKIVFISPGASNPAIKDAGDYIFRNYLSDDFDGLVMADYMFNILKKEKVAILSVNNDYGIGIHNAFVENFSKLGGQILLEERYEQGQTNFSTTLIKIKKLEPEAIFVAGHPAENGNIVKQMKEYNIQIPVTGNLSFENDEFINVARGSFSSVIFSTPYYNVDSEEPHVRFFVKEYERKYNKKPDIAAAVSYDVVNILIKALQDSNYNLEDVKNKLYDIENYQGVTGKTTFDSNGDVLKDIYIKEVMGSGEIKILEQFYTGSK